MQTSRTPEYRKAYSAKHYLDNKAYYLKKARANQQRVRKFIQAAKSAPCADCKNTYPYYVMDFDHFGEKRYEISRIHLMVGMEKVKEELAQCDVVCSNCHRIRTHKRSAKLVPEGKATIH